MTDAAGNTNRAGSAIQESRRQYWRFYWPLSLTGMAMVLARQCQNGALGRFEDATRELAVFAFAWSTFQPFSSPLGFVPQMTTALARSPLGRRKCLIFTLAVSVVLTVPLLVLAFTPVGRVLLPRVFPLDDAMVDSIVIYLRLLCPLIVVSGLRQHLMGLLIQSRRTGLATVLQVFALAVIVGMLIGGLRAGWSAVQTLALAQVVAAAAALVLTWLLERRFRRPPLIAETEVLRYRRILTFFWPVALTSLMFALSRPILYSYAGRITAGLATVAAMRVAGDVAMVFQNCLNQFRHLFVTFGRADLAGVRRFMIRVGLAITAVMVLIAATPIGTWIFRDLLRVEPHVLPLTRGVLGVLCLVPMVITVRNYFHGLAMTGRSTVAMGVGGVLRVVTLYLGAATFYHAGWLNHLTAAGLLVGGFAVEAAVVIVTLLIQRKPRPPRGFEMIIEGESDD